MSELRTTDIEGWLHPSIQDEVIVRGSVPPQERLNDATTPVVIATDTHFAASRIEMTQVSPNHRRSYELGHDVRRKHLGHIAIWHDEYDNAYTSYSLKGNNFSESRIMQSLTAPSGYIPVGLLESDALLRVIRSSRMLREAGVSTEWVSRVFEPNKLIYKGELVSQAEYKARLLDDIAKTHEFDEVLKIAAAIEPMTFFITGRSMEINDRPGDLLEDINEQHDGDRAHYRLKHALRTYNKLHQADDGFRPLRIDRLSDRDHFFTDVFPRLMGRNMATLHNLGLTHHHPVMGNVTLLGGLIDLDSVNGEPLALGDAPITDDDRMQDLWSFTNDDQDFTYRMDGLYSILERDGVVRSDRYEVAVDNFLETYAEHRTKPSSSRDEAIASIVMGSAKQHLDGKVLAGYTMLAMEEAKKATSHIAEQAAKNIERTLTPEYAAWIADYCLDTLLLLQLSRAAQGEHVDFSNGPAQVELDLTLPNELKSLMYYKARWDGLAYRRDGIVKAIGECEEDTSELKKLLSDQNNRLRVLEQVARFAVTEEYEKKVMKGDGIMRLKDNVESVAETAYTQLVRDFNSHNVEPFMATSSFTVENKAAYHTAGIEMLHQNLIHAYENTPRETFLGDLIHGDYEVILHKEIAYIVNNADFQDMKLRAVISDAPRIEMNRLGIYDTGYTFAAELKSEDDFYDRFSTQPFFIAYIGESLTPHGKPVVHIRAEGDMISGMLDAASYKYSVADEK